MSTVQQQSSMACCLSLGTHTVVHCPHARCTHRRNPPKRRNRTPCTLCRCGLHAPSNNRAPLLHSHLMGSVNSGASGSASGPAASNFATSPMFRTIL